MGLGAQLPRERPARKALLYLEKQMGDKTEKIFIQDQERVLIIVALAIVEALDAKL